MAMSDAIKNTVVAAFNALGDGVQDITYHRNTAQPSYNRTTGIVSKTESDVTMKCVFDKYNSYESRNPAIHPTDVKGLIPGSYFSGFVPKIGSDTLTDEDSQIYDVVNYNVDPYKALYTVQLRRIS